MRPRPARRLALALALSLAPACTGRILDPRTEPADSLAAGRASAAGRAAGPMHAADGGGGAGRAAMPAEPQAGTRAMAGMRGGAAGASGVGPVTSNGGAAASGGAGAAAGAMSTKPDVTQRIYGVTVDQLEPLPDILVALQMLGRKPTARIVFDPNRTPRAYADGVHQIHAVSHVMGEVLDSVNVANVSVDDYAARTQQFLDALSDDVDIWEIGNEINGEWLGESAEVSAKILAAYRAVHARGKATALTLFYNQHCYMQADHEMFTWAAANVDDELKSGLDYVLISFYEDNCQAPSPNWNEVFARLAQLFPRSKLGFGECGTTNPANKAAYVERYYGLRVDEPSYVGGYFWWYFRQDMLPYTSPLWSVLNDSIVNTQ